VVAFIAGFGKGLGQAWASSLWFMLVLVLFGLVVGFVNITNREAKMFLIATAALVIVNGGASLRTAISGPIPYVGPVVANIVDYVVVMAAAAALVVAFRVVYKLASDK